jgi:hypothetical protein
MHLEWIGLTYTPPAKKGREREGENSIYQKMYPTRFFKMRKKEKKYHTFLKMRGKK